jgi:hypothetical protein
MPRPSAAGVVVALSQSDIQKGKRTTTILQADPSCVRNVTRVTIFRHGDAENRTA